MIYRVSSIILFIAFSSSALAHQRDKPKTFLLDVFYEAVAGNLLIKDSDFAEIAIHNYELEEISPKKIISHTINDQG